MAKSRSGGGEDWAASKARERKARKRRPLKWLGLGLLSGVVLLVVFLPSIAGVVAPGIVRGQSASMKGSVDLRSASFGWFGAQRLRGLRVIEADGTVAADLDLTVDRGLLGLIGSGFAPGAVRVSGRLEIERGADGTINIAEAASPKAPGPTPPPAAAPGPLTVPPMALGFEFEAVNLEVIYRDAALSGVERVLVPSARAKLEVSSGGDVVVDADGRAEVAGVAAGRAGGARGTGAAGPSRVLGFTLHAEAPGLIGAGGVVEAESATLSVRAELQDVAFGPLVAAGLLSPEAGAALGDRGRAGLVVSGTLNDLRAVVSAESTGGLGVGGELAYRAATDAGPGSVRVVRPLTVTMSGPFVAAMSGGVEGMEWVTAPGVSFTVSALEAPVPAEGEPDLRGLRAEVGLAVTAAAAMVEVPGLGERRRVDVEPVELRVSTRALGDGVTIAGGAGLGLDGRPGGTFTADLVVGGLLDERGAIASGVLPTIDGRVAASDVALEALQPIASAFGLDLTRDVGPLLNLELTAEPAGGTTAVALRGSAEHARVSADMSIDPRSFRLTGEGLSLRLDRLGGVIDHALTSGAGGASAAPARVAAAGPLELRVPAASADLERLAAGDLSAISATIGVTLGSVSGRLTPPGAAERSFVVRGVRATADLADLRGGATLRAGALAEVDGRAAGTLGIDLRAQGLLGDDGRARGGLPGAISGELTLTGLVTALAEPFLVGTGLSMGDAIGPTADLRLSAVTDGPADASGIPPTRLTLGLASEHLKADAALLLTADRLTSLPEGVRVTHGRPGPVLNGIFSASAPPGGPAPSLVGVGAAGLTVSGLDIPLDPTTRAPVLENASGRVILRASGLGLSLPDGPQDLGTLESQVSLTPGGSPRVVLTAGTPGSEPYLEASFTLLGAMDPSATPQLEGRLSVSELRVALLDAFSAPIATPSGRSVTPSELLGVLGATRAGVTLTATPLADGLTGVSLDVATRGPRGTPGPSVTTRVPAVSLTDPASAEHWSTEILARLDPSGMVQLLEWFAPQAQVRRGDSGPVSEVSLNIERRGATIALRAQAPGMAMPGMTIEPAQEGGEPVTLAPFRLSASAAADLPAAALFENAAGTADVRTEFSVVDASGAALGRVTVTTRAGLLGAVPAGEISVRAAVEGLAVAIIEPMLGGAGSISGAVGPSLSLTADITGSVGPDGAPERLAADLSVQSQRLRTTEPIRVAMAGGRVESTAPGEVLWDADPAWLNRMLRTPSGAEPAATIAELSGARLRLRSLRVPADPAAGLSDLALDLSLAADALAARLPTGEVRRFTALGVALRTDPAKPNAVAITAGLTGPGGVSAVRLDGEVANLDASAGPYPIATLTGEVGRFPVALLQALGRMEGDLSGLLGPELSMTAQLRQFPARDGTIELAATTGQAQALDLGQPQALVQLRGIIRQQRADERLFLVAQGRPVASINAFDQSFGDAGARFLPIFGGISKSAGQNPAKIELSELVYPLDGAVADVQFTGTVDPGEVDFSLGGALASALNFAGQREQGELGRRLQPFAVAMKDGVATYRDMSLPLGEFTLDSYGDFDFVNDRQTVHALAPAGNIRSDFFESLGPVAGRAVKQGVKAGFVSEGPIGQPGRFTPTFKIDDMFDPAGLINDLLRDRLRGVFPGRGGGGE